MLPETFPWKSARAVACVLLWGLLLFAPLILAAVDQSYYLSFTTRVVIYAIAATGLNFALGYGGMPSLGHALFVGIGVYAVGIASTHGITNGWLHLAMAALVTLVVATITGLISLRTRGIGFIMITLAFGQMFYFLAVSLKQYGGDDGLPLYDHSRFWPLPPLNSPTALYYVALAALALLMFLAWRAVHSRFGAVLRGFKANERRMLAAGYPRLRYQVTAYMASALACALAGVLLVNLTAIASPSYMSWQSSGELMIMVVLGGMGTIMGPLVGAFVLLLLEDSLSAWTTHWMIILGPLILLAALLSNRGVWGGLMMRGHPAGALLPTPSSDLTQTAAASTGSSLAPAAADVSHQASTGARKP